MGKFLLTTALALVISTVAMAQTVIPTITPAKAADIPLKAPPLPYAYPTTKCGMYYGVNTMGSTAAINNTVVNGVAVAAPVGAQIVQGAIGLTLGYTCPMGTAGYWFADGDFDIAQINGNTNGFSFTGPAKFEQRFGFGAPVEMILSMIPGLGSLQNAVPSLIPLPTGVAVVTSSPYVFGSLHEDDIGVSNGFATAKQFLTYAGIGIGNKVRLTNGIVFDPYAEFTLSSTAMCFGIQTNCNKLGQGVLVGTKLEF
jgi:hypothetical protein